MTHYDYRVIPAPKQVKRVKGVHGAEELFAPTLTEAINEVARQGWEYVRAERLPAEAPRGWFRAAVAERAGGAGVPPAARGPGPRLAPPRTEEPAAARAGGAGAARPPAEQAAVNRLAQRMRREPPLRLEPLPRGADEPSPLRPGPRLGPPERS